jgi:hypothetical protein
MAKTMLSILRKIIRKLKRKKRYSPLATVNGKKVIFIHINKTGGTSVIHLLNLAKSHLTVKEIIKIIGQDEFDSAFKFAAVRNPWDKVLSHYKYRVKTNQTSLGTNKIPFKDWVKQTYGAEKNPYYYDQPKMFQQQIEWLKNNEDKIQIDDVMTFEALNEEFARISSKLKISATLPHLNSTDKVDYRTFYDDETRQIVEKWFADDIAYFGYEF